MWVRGSDARREVVVEIPLVDRLRDDPLSLSFDPKEAIAFASRLLEIARKDELAG